VVEFWSIKTHTNAVIFAVGNAMEFIIPYSDAEGEMFSDFL
jgi:hypothetical protein